MGFSPGSFFLSQTLKNPRRVAQVPGEGITTTESGCPRCLAFGHLGEHRDYFPEFPR